MSKTPNELIMQQSGTSDLDRAKRVINKQSDVCDMKGCTGKPLMVLCRDCWRQQIEEIDRLREEARISRDLISEINYQQAEIERLQEEAQVSSDLISEISCQQTEIERLRDKLASAIMERDTAVKSLKEVEE